MYGQSNRTKKRNKSRKIKEKGKCVVINITTTFVLKVNAQHMVYAGNPKWGEMLKQSNLYYLNETETKLNGHIIESSS